MARTLSSGILLYRFVDDRILVFLVHPGGPFWARKDEGSWSIPKGEYDPSEDPLAAARREFQEETGFSIDGRFLALTPVKQPSGKVVSAWAVEGYIDATSIRSNLFSMEWPPKSGRIEQFPEADRAMWCGLTEARNKILSGQRPFLDELEQIVSNS